MAVKYSTLRTSQEFLASQAANISNPRWLDDNINLGTLESFFASRGHSINNPQPLEITLNLGKPQVYLDRGTTLERATLDVTPYATNGRTLVPLRGVMESLGAKVEWIQATNQVLVVKGEISITLTLGSREVEVDGQIITIDVAPKIKNARTMIPLRFLSETLGYDVKWFSHDSAITIKER